MPKQNNEITRIAKVLNKLNINDIGKNCGFCARQRIIKPFELVMSLVTALGERRVDSLAELHRYFVSMTKTDVQYKPFHNQLSKPEFVELMKRLIGEAMKQWQQQVLDKTTELTAFEGIVLQDGSSFAVHDELKETYKGRFTAFSPAAVEIHVSWDVMQSYPELPTITPDSEAEFHHLPAPETLKNKLLLADRGYFDLRYINAVEQAGGHCLIRAKTTANPTVIRGYNKHGKILKRFNGAKLKSIKHHIKRSQVVDMDVQGKHAYRLIASWPAGRGRPVIWATTLPRQEYSAQAMMKLYQLRWQIELLFKEWKSYCNLGKFNTRKASMAEGLIWASLLALLLKRRISTSVSEDIQEDISTFITAKSTQGWFYNLMEALISNSPTKLRKAWDWTVKFLSKYAKRADPKRDRKTGRMQYGVKSVFS